ncbi:Hypp7119 [Branchiostoma lanceolatum]|uniref:Hypp7119 protein n=1 Tax=Branchiostoma lanceolatum TaxID=7740 RepID=A0A8J9YXP9_BRALA|nr:Hypp7119 [Branchiostoma lanceolatum]
MVRQRCTFVMLCQDGLSDTAPGSGHFSLTRLPGNKTRQFYCSLGTVREARARSLFPPGPPEHHNEHVGVRLQRQVSSTTDDKS